MPKYTARLLTTALAATLLGAAACGGDNADAAQRDIALTPPPAQPGQPVLRDVAEPPPPANVSPKPATKAPAPTKAAPVTPTPVPTPPPVVSAPPVLGPSHGVIASGTNFTVKTSEKACTNTQKVGDRLVATVAETVPGSEGVSIPAGATATLEVTESQYGKNDEKLVKFGFKVVSVTFDGHTYDVNDAPVVSPPVTKVRRQSTGDQAKKVAVGAAAGAIVGKILGKNTKNTVAGGVAGAAGGAIIAAGTADYDGCVAADRLLTVNLTQSLRIRVAN